ncbi:mRNA turnover 4 [Pleodorina starrii]|nr:mRNA turnover 4 [Pleodorina starrii]
MGDFFHLEVHRGRLYVCAGVPSSGPPLAPGAVEVRPTGDVRGNGAFASARIPAGTHIADYSGDRLDRAAFLERYPDSVGDYAMAIDDEFVLDAAHLAPYTASFHAVHMNHSSTRANVGRYYRRREGRVSFFATRDIEVGEELLYDYGRSYWYGREHLELP